MAACSERALIGANLRHLSVLYWPADRDATYMQPEGKSLKSESG